MEYKAFISYKHLISTEFAKDLEYHIKRYAKNVFQKPDKIFRDEQYLKTGGDLTALIKSALKNADYLILLASPEAAISPWVISELEIWCNELKRADKIIVVLTSGSIHIDGIKKEIDWEKTDALPHLLKGHLPVLPLFVDLSWATEKKSRVLSNGKYKTAINAIAASIRDEAGRLIAGLSISAPASRLKDEWIGDLTETASRISRALGYQGS